MCARMNSWIKIWIKVCVNRLLDVLGKFGEQFKKLESFLLHCPRAIQTLHVHQQRDI